jgi:hypothetical protein
MELLLTLVAAFPIGFLIRHRLVAFVVYLAAHAFVFTFQTLVLLVAWIGGSGEGFGPYPQGSTAEVFSYGVVNLVIFAAGLGLVYLGHRLAARRRARAAVPVEANMSSPAG